MRSEQSPEVEAGTIDVERVGERSFTALTESIAPARRYVRQAAETLAVDRATLADIELAASELISNAVEHGSGNKFSVAVAADGAQLVIEVASEHTGRNVAEPTDWIVPSTDALSGRGLGLVRAVSSSAWVEQVNGRVTIGCRFDRG